MRQLLKTLMALTFLLLIFSCKEEVVPPEMAPDFAIEAFNVPLRLNVAKPRVYNIAFRVTHPEGVSAIGEVTITFLGSDQATQLLQLPLYDDGGFIHDDRDIIAGDGIFSNYFISDSLVFPLGDVYMQVRAVDNAQNSIQTDLIGALALLNAAPKVVSAVAPDTLFSGSPPLFFSVAVQDSNDVEDITGVVMRLKRGGNEIDSYSLEFQSKTAADSGIFGAFFDSTFAAERDSFYTLEFQAVDFSDDVSDVLAKTIFLENIAPVIFNVSMRDTLQRPSTGVDTLHIIISANDSQGLSDIDSVYFRVTLIGGNTSSPQEMFDDGDPNNGDEIQGDGRYSNIIQIEPQNQPGTYMFEFRAVDKVGHTSNVISDTLEVLP